MEAMNRYIPIWALASTSLSDWPRSSVPAASRATAAGDGFYLAVPSVRARL